MRRPPWARALLRLAAAASLALALAAPRAARAADAAPGSLPNIDIDQIEVTGVVSFTQSEIEDLLEIAPGDRLEKVKVLRTAENLEEFYRSHGYEQASVRTKFSRQKGPGGEFESVLDFVVTEGKPTRIAAVRFTPDSIRNEAFRKYWRGLEAELGGKAGLVPGDIYDQDQVAGGRRAIQDLLASEEFVGAKVDDIRVQDSEPPVLAGPDKARDTGRWVTLDFHIDLGDRVVFGFRGNTVFSHSRLSSLVDEQRVLGFGKDYIGAIRSRIEEEYRSEGYADAQVTVYTAENPARAERRVTYAIQEGQRVTLDDVSFDGNSVFSNDELKERFYRNASVLLQHGYYVEKDVQKALDLVVEWLKSNGYLAAKVVTITTLPGIKPKRAGQKLSSVRLVVYVYEGDQTLVQSVKLEGLSAFTQDEVKAKLGLREGLPLNLFAFSEGLEALKAAYRARGYLEVRIANEGTDKVVQYSDENRQADIQLQIVEGPQYKVSAIEIEGLVSTKETVVRRELEFKVGDILSETAMSNTQARLTRLGIFSLVAIHVHDDPARADAKRVVISVQEGTPGVIAGGPGFRNDLGARVFGQVAYADLWGLNHTLSLTTNVNHRFYDFHFVEYQAQLAYLYPWFLGKDITFRPSLTASGTQYIDFDANVVNVALTWEKRIWSHPAVTAVLTYSLEQVRQFNAPVLANGQENPDNQELRIGAIIPGLRFDTRDNPLSPTTGWFGTVNIEFASPLFLSQTMPFPIGYTRAQARVDRIFSLGGGISWFLSYRAGYEVSTEPAGLDNNGKPIDNLSAGAIPLISQFALGGESSVRGYNEQELNAQLLEVYGSLSYSNYRTQLDFPIAGSLRFGPFLDAANLLVDHHSIGEFFFQNLMFGAGVGFHYQTPVGPVNLDVGFRLSPMSQSSDKTDSPLPGQTLQQQQFYFSIGFI